MLKTFTVVITLLGLAGCQAMGVPSSLKNNVTVPQGPDNYREAFVHGCNSGYVSSGNSGTYKKSADRYADDAEYIEGWNKGFKDCATNTEVTREIQKAIALAALPTDIDTIELINYFSFDKHKAFAINPERRANFWWAYNVGSEAQAKRDVLKKCGPKCQLFALNNVVVWNGENFSIPTR